MDRPPSFTSAVARPAVQLSDPSYNNNHAPPSVGSVAIAQLQLSDPRTDPSYNNNELATSVGSVAMAQLQLSDQQLTNTSYSNKQAPSMSYQKEDSQSVSDGFSYNDNAWPRSLTDVAGRDRSYSIGTRPMESDNTLASISENSYDDASTIDPDVDLSYLDERLRDVLGRFQKDFEGGVSYENLGPKFGGYGSFLPTYKRFPANPHS